MPITLDIVGSKAWPRFVIVAPDMDCWWDGEGWVAELRKARLYAHENLAHQDLAAVIKAHREDVDH
jgi:hypothetical protein